MISSLIYLAEIGVIPDGVIRAGIRLLLRNRLESLRRVHVGTPEFEAIVAKLDQSPVAVETARANEQHYEVPSDFFKLTLGRHLKYSGSYYSPDVSSLDEAEAEMLRRYTERGQITDGQSILELGCGWGSLTLWLGQRLPNARIVALSNSNSQREYIEAKAKERGIANITVRTGDINAFVPGETFDRIVSIEMFEHMRNYRRLFEQVASWLKPDGKLFLHIFCHRRSPYLFESAGAQNWMGRYFFTGGTMPSADLFPKLAGHLKLEEEWLVNGTHYAKTAEAWLQNLDQNRAAALAVLQNAYGSEARRWLNRWRIFFMACAELFGYARGEEWLVAHYLFSHRNTART